MPLRAASTTAPAELETAFGDLCESLELCEHLESFISNPKRKSREPSQVRQDDVVRDAAHCQGGP